jgi:hypothetical protein
MTMVIMIQVITVGMTMVIMIQVITVGMTMVIMDDNGHNDAAHHGDEPSP